jgi:hypothetical protein
MTNNHENLNQLSEEILELPDDIDESWCDSFNEKVCKGRYEIELRAEDWLVQPPNEIGSAYYELDDQMGPEGWRWTVKGKVWNAHVTDTPQYINDSKGPVVSLLDAVRVYPGGKEEKIIDEDGDWPDNSGRLTLIRLDRIISDRPVLLRDLGDYRTSS